MRIQLMNNTEPVNKITKNPSNVGNVLEGSLVDGTSVVDPDILIDSSIYPNCNYAYIVEFGRYYHVTNIESEKQGLWRLHLHCDPLRSFQNEILSNPAVIARSSSSWNLYLNDSQYKAYADPIMVTRVFPYGFNTFQYVLAMLGGHD